MLHGRMFGWEFGRRHRWGFGVITAYIAALAGFRLITDAAGHIDDLRFAFTVIVPLTSAALYLLAVFSFGLRGDLAARESLFPARLLILPVATRELVDWPMFYGMTALVALWLVTALLALRPAGVHVPIVWPAVFAAVFLAWEQALVWMPYGLRNVRVLLAAAWLGSVDAVVLLAIHFRTSEAVMIALLAPQIPIAYLTARHAVTLARRGHVPDWTIRTARIGSDARGRHRARRDFHSPVRAQLWLEWHEHGRSLLALVPMVLPFELALLWIAKGAPDFIFLIMAIVAVTPPIMAACTAATMRQALTSFDATRPMTDAGLVAIKLTVAVWSTLITWIVVLLATPAALELSGTMAPVLVEWRKLEAFAGTARAVTFIILLLAALMMMTWRQLVQSLCIGLSGRVWLSRVSTAVTLALLVAIVPVSDWILGSQEVMAATWGNLPRIFVALVLLKMSAAAWTATRLWRSRLVSDRILVTGAAVWSVTVFALHAVLLWFVNLPQMPAYFLALIAILALPLARVSAAPLAVAWNRHR